MRKLAYTDDAEQIRNEIDAELWSEGLPKKGVLMSYSREEFEQAFLNQYTDFERFENGEYMDDFLQQSWIGWQASRQIEGEPLVWRDLQVGERKMVGDRFLAYEGIWVEVTADHLGFEDFVSQVTRPMQRRVYTRPASESKGRIEGDKSGYGRIADSSGDKQAVSVPEWQLEARRAFWAGIEIAECFTVVAIAPRWDEYIAKRKEDLSQYVTRAGDGDE